MSTLRKVRVGLAIALVLLFGLPFFLFPEQIKEKSILSDWYNSTIGSSWYNDNIRPWTKKYLSGAHIRHFNIPQKGSRAPPNTTGQSGAFGWSGIFAGASVVFFAFIGFDAVSTAAHEAKNPQRDMPMGILLSLLICVVLYILFAHVLAGVANYTEFRTVGQEASITYVIDTYMKGYGWLSALVTVAILAGFSSVILVMLMGQSRVFFSMSKDGLVPKVFSQLHPKFKTPWKSNLLFFIFVGLIAAFVPASIISDMTVIGTLFAFVLVCLGIIILRKTDQAIPRPFRTPWVPVIPILGILACTGLIYTLGPANWLRLIIWLVIGVFIYIGYGIKNSKLQKDTSKKSTFRK